jgi:exodeoxyribonuclease VII large subunit
MMQEEKIWEVGEFLDYVNIALRSKKITLVGESSEIKHHPTGVYFILKDRKQNGIIKCYIRPSKWKEISKNILFEEGLLFKTRGTPYIYKPKSDFTFEIEEIELFGEGSLRKAYEMLKNKLEKEGLFVRKRSLPQIISSIGLITSKEGAAIGDFLKNLHPHGIKIYFYNVRVEGINSVSQIQEALDYFNKKMYQKVDVLVLIRGGGSLEDLQAFNNEEVVRKIFSSKIPVISGIGHEKDVPLAALVSDVNVSTPSFAAQVINNSWNKINEEIFVLSKKIISLFEKMILILPLFEKSITQHFKSSLEKEKIYLKEKNKDVINNFLNIHNKFLLKINQFTEYLKAVNPLQVLKLGYSIVKDKNGKIIKNASFLKKGEKIITRFYKGSTESIIEKILKD